MKLETCLCLVHGLEKMIGGYHSYLTYTIRIKDREHGVGEKNENEYGLWIKFPKETTFKKFEQVCARLQSIHKSIRIEINFEERELFIDEWSKEMQAEIQEKINSSLGKLELTCWR